MFSAAVPGGAAPFVVLDAASVRSLLPHSVLVPHFQSTLPSLSASIHAPPRSSFPIDPAASSALLLMPAWSTHPSLPYIGVKIVTSYPSNSALSLPTIQASYLLFNSLTGTPLSAIDATELTLIRTSAVPALAAKFLARADSKVLLIVGAGALAPHLVAAHRCVLPNLTRIVIWNRTEAKARDLARRLAEEEPAGSGVAFEHVSSIGEAVGAADVICCATAADRALIEGRRLKAGAHLGMVGSFTPAMRECDDEAISRGRVFVDFEVAMEEAGELVGAFERGVISRGDVQGTLAELVAGVKVGRSSDDEVTVFKSVGAAPVDILAAHLAYESHLEAQR